MTPFSLTSYPPTHLVPNDASQKVLSFSSSQSSALFIVRDLSAECATKPGMCLISFRAHSHQRVTNLASRATTKERSKRVPGSHGCSSSNLGSGGVTDCPAVLQTRRTKTEFHCVFQDLRCVIETKTTKRGGTSRGFSHNTQKFLSFAQGRTQRIGSAPPSKQAREAASPRFGHKRPHKVIYRTSRTLARDRLCVSQCVSFGLCRLPPFFTPQFCRECLRRPHEHVSSSSFLGHNVFSGFCCTFDRTSIVSIMPQHM